MDTKYELLIEVTKQNLQALMRILDKAQAHVTEKGVPESEILGAKLYEDMMDFTKQIQVSTDYARKDLAYLSGKEPVAMNDTETSLAELKERVQKTIEIVNSFGATDFVNADTQEVRLRWFQGTHMLGKDFIEQFAVSNFLFHVVTAYDILRNKGVVIGKSDFIGEMKMRPDTSA